LIGKERERESRQKTFAGAFLCFVSTIEECHKKGIFWGEEISKKWVFASSHQNKRHPISEPSPSNPGTAAQSMMTIRRYDPIETLHEIGRG